MITFEIVKDNTDEVLNDIEKRSQSILDEIGKLVADKAKEIVPVDTGALRESITYEVTNDSVSVGSPLEYAVYVELGTSKMGAQPYLRPALENSTNEIRNVIQKGYKQ